MTTITRITVPPIAAKMIPTIAPEWMRRVVSACVCVVCMCVCVHVCVHVGGDKLYLHTDLLVVIR